MSVSVSDLKVRLDPDKPVLLVGPTASGKSALALEIAKTLGGPIINGDAIQVYSDWRILTARPSISDEAEWPHHLYGHIGGTEFYSVGHWLRDVSKLLAGRPPVIVGGTGLYFTALTKGLADIPETPNDVRATADRKMAEHGTSALLAELDPETRTNIDQNNPVRIQRAWEVLMHTGRGLFEWQSETGPPLLRLPDVTALVLDAPKDWLTPRINKRFQIMLESGLLDEARKNAPTWSPNLPSSKAIGAAECINHVMGRLTIGEAQDQIQILTRQYAKRQRSWFRSRMSDWIWVSSADQAH